MRRVIVNVATGDHHIRGQQRLLKEIKRHAPDDPVLTWDSFPRDWRRHQEFPFSFKCHALRTAAEMGYDQFLWLDACMFPLRSLEPIWDYAAEHGAWISRNGFSNYEWTADSAYEHLFQTGDLEEIHQYGTEDHWMDKLRELNRSIEHVVAGAFCLDLNHAAGRDIFDDYCYLGLETDAFRGPWVNGNQMSSDGTVNATVQSENTWPCGPPDVRGHRHDQTALSVCAWRAGVPLTSPPAYLAYGKAGDVHNNATILLADGGF